MLIYLLTDWPRMPTAQCHLATDDTARGILKITQTSAILNSRCHKFRLKNVL